MRLRHTLSKLVLGLALVAGLTPGPLAAQFGGVDALARRISSASFYFNRGGLLPTTDELVDGDHGIVTFGVETLIEIGTVRGDPTPSSDSVSVEWTRMEVTQRREADTVYTDTVYYYDVEQESPRPGQVVWLFELGLGYGQVSGFESARQDLDLRGSIRDLPAVSLYATHEDSGVYFGIRSGFMKLQGLQIYDQDDTAYQAKAESFLAGGVLGYAYELSDLILLLESGYTVRHFPSLDWNESTLPANIPRNLSISGWSLGAGLQFPVGD